jgi:hypothetical protein
VRLPAVARAASVALVVLAGCDHGCGSLGSDWRALAPRSAGSPTTPEAARAPGGGGQGLLQGIDCPDGLARCEDGRVWVSRLATLTTPCGGASAPCVCPWDSIAACRGACAAEGAVAVMDRERAAVQMCTPERQPELPLVARPARPLPLTPPPPPPPFVRASGPPPFVPAPPPTPFVRALGPDTQPPSDCDEGDAYRCSDSVVIDCGLARGVGRCSNACSSPGAAIFGEHVDRESAFAILCSR